jgi:DNA-binding GntR family transcriptional regulator
MKRGEKKNSPVPLSEVAFQQIKSQIVHLALLPGEQIDETVMAETLGIGRTPIRESLFRLAAEGLLRGKNRSRFFCARHHPGRHQGPFRNPVGTGARCRCSGGQTDWRFGHRPARTSQRRISGRLETAAFPGCDPGQQPIPSRTLCGHRKRFHENLSQFIANSESAPGIHLLHPAGCHRSGTHAEESIRDHHLLIVRLKEKDEAGAVELITGHIQRFRKQVADYTTPALLELGIVA